MAEGTPHSRPFSLEMFSLKSPEALAGVTGAHHGVALQSLQLEVGAEELAEAAGMCWGR